MASEVPTLFRTCGYVTYFSKLLSWKVDSRGAFRNLSSIYDEAFRKNSERQKINYSCKKLSHTCLAGP